MIKKKKKTFTHLIGKHIARDLIGNNVGVVGEDIVENGAVIFICLKQERQKSIINHH